MTSFPRILAAAALLLGASCAAAQGGTGTVKIFVIALEDGGKSGRKVGCGDSVVALRKEVDPTSAPLQAALSALLTLAEELPGERMYNSLAGSELRLKRAQVRDGKATVELEGELRLGGVCDNPRLEAQLRQTILQFPEVRSAEISVNGRPLEQVLSLK